MSAARVIRHLLEEPEDEPFGLDPLKPYLGPLEFDANIKDIVEHARMLKEQAAQAGALAVLQHTNSSGRPPLPVDIDRAFLLIAVEQYGNEFRMPQIYAKRLKREMHSIWD